VRNLQFDATEKLVDVFFVDYGESELVSPMDIQPMPTHLEQTPFQAIECCLIDIECADAEWDDTFDKLVTIGEKVLHAEASISAEKYVLFASKLPVGRCCTGIFSAIVSIGRLKLFICFILHSALYAKIRRAYLHPFKRQYYMDG
jgi:Tudor domain